ncbi:uncharacterized protein LOC106407578 isoform X1 [Brassica napus]|uniref:uncharacterized protein LOC106407578 isoform X1 n=1 Tax=Brassica napus TaxID=3708 RepID=UPI0006AA6DF5|nr:uncharacterized protein LOC106407578 isoform X1 [Brassica napus]
MLISHDSLDVNGRRRLACVADQRRREAIHGKGARRRRIRHTTILSTIGEARARAWQVATPPVAGFEEIHARCKCLCAKLKVDALARARKEFVHKSNGFVLCRSLIKWRKIMKGATFGG